MKREIEINRATNSYISIYFGSYIRDVERAFRNGIEWADENPKNIWHDASEEPDNLTQIVCVCNMFGSKQVCSFHVDKGNPIEWKHIVKFRHLEKWAYIDELIED